MSDLEDGMVAVPKIKCCGMPNYVVISDVNVYCGCEFQVLAYLYAKKFCMYDWSNCIC